jgi:hypothetical protein
MPISYDIETDYLYLRGIENGLEKAMQKGGIEEREQNTLMFVTNLILNSDFDDFKIAQLSNSTLDFVRKVRNDLTKNKQ